MKRGDIVTVSAAGSYGKPRPAVVVQSNWLKETNSVLVSLMTSDVRDAPLFRLTLEPSPTNKLKTTTQIMVDKIIAIPRTKCRKVMGCLDEGSLVALNQRLVFVLGLGD